MRYEYFYRSCSIPAKSNRWHPSWQAAILLSAIACIGTNGVFILWQCFADKSTQLRTATSSTIFVTTIIASVVIFIAWIGIRLISTIRALRRIPYDTLMPLVGGKDHQLMTSQCKNHLLNRYQACLYMDLGPGFSPWDIRYSHGWGKRGTRNEGVHFKRAIIHSAKFIEQSIFKIVPTISDDVREFGSPIGLENLSEFLQARCSSINMDPSLLERYFSELDKAQNTKKEFSEHEYKEVMKLVVTILKSIGVPQFDKQVQQT
jgi:hypothetical protein